MTMKTFKQIAAEYAPYHTMRTFVCGAEDYMDRKYACPFTHSVGMQAWDRGQEAASRFTLQYGQYVGASLT
jgi:hypothetical protein